jgi:hypothetical protein
VNWLQDILEDAVRESIHPCLCCWRYGARPFAHRIRSALPGPASVEFPRGPWSVPEIITLAKALSELEWNRDPQLLDRDLDYIRLNPCYLFLGAKQLVYLIWEATPADTLRRDVDPILLPSPIGFLLRRRWQKTGKQAEQAYLHMTEKVRRARKAEQNQRAHAERKAWYRERNDLDKQALKWVSDNADQFDRFLETSQGYAVSQAQNALTPDAAAWVIPMQNERWGELYVLCIRLGEQSEPRTFLAEVFPSRVLAERAFSKPRRVCRSPQTLASADSWVPSGLH